MLQLLANTVSPWLSAGYAKLLASSPTAWTLLAQIELEEEAERAYSLEVGLIMLCVLLGILATLRPTKREAEFKKPQGD
ncbi:MAG: hypothetical protein AAGJ46_07625 [Planctomycetota bacterium]